MNVLSVVIEREYDGEVCGLVTVSLGGKDHILLFTLTRNGRKASCRLYHSKGSEYLTDDILESSVKIAETLAKVTQ